MPRGEETERRHLTVMFCDLVDATVLAGHIAQYLRRFLEKILPYGTRPDYTLACLTSNPFVRCSSVYTCPTPALASVPHARTESRYPLSCLENAGSHTARL
jgi:hypothetical protein